MRLLALIGHGIGRVLLIIGAVLSALTPNRTNAPLTPPESPPEHPDRADYRP